MDNISDTLLQENNINVTEVNHVNITPQFWENNGASKVFIDHMKMIKTHTPDSYYEKLKNETNSEHSASTNPNSKHDTSLGFSSNFYDVADKHKELSDKINNKTVTTYATETYTPTTIFSDKDTDFTKKHKASTCVVEGCFTSDNKLSYKDMLNWHFHNIRLELVSKCGCGDAYAKTTWGNTIVETKDNA